MAIETPVPERRAGLLRRTLVGLFWTSSGAGARVVLQFVVLAILARLLMPEEFGLIGAAMVVIAFSDVVCQLGIAPALVQRPDLKPEHVRTGFTLSLAIGVLLAPLIWLLAPAFAGFFRMDQLTAILSLLVLRLPLQGLSAVAEALLQRHLRFRQLAAIEISSYLAYSIVGILLAILDFGVWALACAHLAASALKTVCLVIVQPHPKGMQFDLSAFRDLVFFGAGITLARAFDWFARQGDHVVVGRWLGAEALGLYGRAYQLTVTPSSELGNIVERVLFPAMATVQNDRLRLTTAYVRGAGLMALLIVPFSAAVCVLAPEIVHIVLGPDWGAAVTPFRILAFGMFFRAGCKMADTLARSKGAVYELAWRYGVYAALVLTGAWIAYPFGIGGIALAVVTALIVQCALTTQLSLRITNTTWSQFCMAYVPAMVLTTIVTTLLLSVASVARYYSLPALMVGLTAISVTLSCVFVLSRVIPSWIIGKDGTWLLDALWRFR